jgi:twinkle protein
MDNLVALKTHQPCEDCGSSDALTINVDGSSKCYSCGEFKPNGNRVAEIPDSEPMKRNGFIQGECSALPSRFINEDTCRKYNYKVGALNGKPCHIANYYNLDGGILHISLVNIYGPMVVVSSSSPRVRLMR